MIEYSNVICLDSKLPEFEGVKFTIVRMSHGLRAQIRLQLAKCLAAIREKSEDIERIAANITFTRAPEEESAIKEIDDAGQEKFRPLSTREDGLTLDQTIALGRVHDLKGSIDIIMANEVDPVYLRQCLVSVEGISIKGEASPSSDILYKFGPELLCLEILTAIKMEMGITGQEKESLKSPTTSGAVAGGQTSGMTAPNASSTDGGEVETASGISRIK